MTYLRIIYELRMPFVPLQILGIVHEVDHLLGYFHQMIASHIHDIVLRFLTLFLKHCGQHIIGNAFLSVIE